MADEQSTHVHASGNTAGDDGPAGALDLEDELDEATLSRIDGAIAGRDWRDREAEYDAWEALRRSPEARLARRLENNLRVAAEAIEDPRTNEVERATFIAYVVGLGRANPHVAPSAAQRLQAFLTECFLGAILVPRRGGDRGRSEQAADYILSQLTLRALHDDAALIDRAALATAMAEWHDDEPGRKKAGAGKYNALAAAISRTSFARSAKGIDDVMKRLRRDRAEDAVQRVLRSRGAISAGQVEALLATHMARETVRPAIRRLLKDGTIVTTGAGLCLAAGTAQEK